MRDHRLFRLFNRPNSFAVLVNPAGMTVNVGRRQTILEAALADGLPFPHVCSVGSCGSCKCRLLKGRVRALREFAFSLSSEELLDNYILACQAVPLTDLELDVTSMSENAAPIDTMAGVISRTSFLTHDIQEIVVETERQIAYVPGQFAELSYPGLDRARPYSFAGVPGEEGTRESTFYVRKVAGGAFTGWLFQCDRTGRALTIRGPFGDFYLRTSDAAVVCVAGGSGLAPIRSILEHAVCQRIGRPITILFGARQRRDLYDMDRLGALAQVSATPVRIIPVLSDEAIGSDWSGARGTVTAFLADVLHQDRSVEVYMCGPPAMIDAGLKVLQETGIPTTSVFYDKFSDGY